MGVCAVSNRRVQSSAHCDVPPAMKNSSGTQLNSEDVGEKRADEHPGPLGLPEAQLQRKTREVMLKRLNCSLTTHQIPSQAMTMKSWSSFIVSTLMSGKAEIICSSGGRFLFRL